MEGITQIFAKRWMSLSIVASVSIALLLVAIVQHPVAAADPVKDKKEQPRQYQASIRISQRQAGQEEQVMSSPTLVYLAGMDAIAITEDAQLRIEMTIRPPVEKKPLEHRVDVCLIGDPKSKNPRLLSASSIPLRENTTGVLTMVGQGGELTIEATVRSLD